MEDKKRLRFGAQKKSWFGWKITLIAWDVTQEEYRIFRDLMNKYGIHHGFKRDGWEVFITWS
jgi:hypothetical protein